MKCRIIPAVPDHHEDGHVPDDARAQTRTDEGPRSALPPGGESGTDDWLLRALERVEETGQLAAAALPGPSKTSPRFDGKEKAERPLIRSSDAWWQPAVPKHGGRPRMRSHRYQHAVMVLRALMIRALVDNSGSSLSEVARAMNISRQKVTQLYRIGASISETADEE